MCVFGYEKKSEKHVNNDDVVVIIWKFVYYSSRFWLKIYRAQSPSTFFEITFKIPISNYFIISALHSS